MDHRVAMLACIIMVLLPAIIAQTTEDPSNITQETPAKCCIPASQFTISKSSSSGVVRLDGPTEFRNSPIAVLEEAHEAHDYVNSRFAAYIIRRFINGYPEQHLRIIEDIEEETVLIIFPYEEKCVKGRAADYPFRADRCVKGYADFLGTSYIDDKALYANTWAIFIPDEPQFPTNGYHSMTVGRDSCIPHGSVFAGVAVGWEVKQHIVSTSGYYNYEEGIADPDAYFGVPDYCEEKPRKNGGAGRPEGRPDAERPSKGRKTD